MAGDVYARTPHAGRGGGVGKPVRRAGCIGPALRACSGFVVTATPSASILHPGVRPAYQISWRFHDTRYKINVTNPEHRCRGVANATVDGSPVDPDAIPIVDDGHVHQVDVVLGNQAVRPRKDSRSHAADRLSRTSVPRDNGGSPSEGSLRTLVGRNVVISRSLPEVSTREVKSTRLRRPDRASRGTRVSRGASSRCW